MSLSLSLSLLNDYRMSISKVKLPHVNISSNILHLLLRLRTHMLLDEEEAGKKSLVITLFQHCQSLCFNPINQKASRLNYSRRNLVVNKEICGCS